MFAHAPRGAPKRVVKSELDASWRPEELLQWTARGRWVAKALFADANDHCWQTHRRHAWSHHRRRSAGHAKGAAIRLLFLLLTLIGLAAVGATIVGNGYRFALHRAIGRGRGRDATGRQRERQNEGEPNPSHRTTILRNGRHSVNATPCPEI